MQLTPIFKTALDKLRILVTQKSCSMIHAQEISQGLGKL